MNNIAAFSPVTLDFEAGDEDLLTLSLSTNPRSTSSPPPLQKSSTSSPQPPSAPQPPHAHLGYPSQEGGGAGSSRARRRSPKKSQANGKSELVLAPYPWATTKRATIYSLEYLLSRGLNTISGEVQCKRCERKYEMEYDLEQKFTEVAFYISKNKDAMHHRAPRQWMVPSLPNCKFCEQNNCVKPILSKKKAINWLFLLLGQMLGCCKLAELKYFCKHTKNHRTGAKDRVLYLTYLALCMQLDPDGPFNL